MSVIVIGRMTVDPANLKKLWREQSADFEAIAEAARTAGAMHHQWAIGSDYVVLIDEWPDAESFQKFFGSQDKIADLMASAGVQGPPDFEILEAGSSAPDVF
jgi:hypothetical protein